MSKQTKALRALLAKPGLVVVPEAISALTGRLVELEGWPATYCGGSALGGWNFAIPDHGLITTTEMAELAGYIAAAVSIPLIADADQGGETSVNVRRAVQSYERAGVAGIHLEDTFNPKHLYLHSPAGPGQQLGYLQSVERMQARVAAAVDARSDADFLIIARTDELFNKGSVDEAIRRGIAYAEAGADAYFCLHMQTPDIIDRIAAEVPIPLLDINVPLPAAEKTRLKIDVFTGPSVYAAAATHLAMLRGLKEKGEFPMDSIQRVGNYGQLVMDDQWLKAAKNWPLS